MRGARRLRIDERTASGFAVRPKPSMSTAIVRWPSGARKLIVRAQLPYRRACGAAMHQNDGFPAAGLDVMRRETPFAVTNCS